MLGVAMPGIAPLAPGGPKEPPIDANAGAPPAPWQGGYAPPPGPAPFQPPPDESRSRSARPPDSARPQMSAAIALVSGLVLAAGAAAFAFLWRSPAPLRAEARVD